MREMQKAMLMLNLTSVDSLKFKLDEAFQIILHFLPVC